MKTIFIFYPLRLIEKIKIVICFVFLFTPSRLNAQAIIPFTCADQASYITRSTVNNGTSALYKANLIAQTNTLIAPLLSLGLNIRVNAIGYNVQDNFIYGAYQGNSTSSAPIATNDIVKIDSLGNVSVIDVPGLPAAIYNAGDVDANNRLYLYVPSATRMYRVNLGTLAVDTLVLNAGTNYFDISVSNDGTKVWGISANNGNFITYTISGTTGTSASLAGYTSTLETLNFYDSRGNIFFQNENTGSIYMGDVVNGEVQLLVTASPAVNTFQTDGAQCRNASVYSNAQPSFTCQPESGYVYDQDGDDLYRATPSTSSYTLVASNLTNTSGGTYNAMGHNPKDNFLWIQRNGTHKLARIGADYSVQDFVIAGLPVHSYNCGEFDTSGIFYLMDGSAVLSSTKTIYKVDLNPASPTYLQYLGSVTTSIPTSAIIDFAMNPIDGNLYTVSGGNLLRINPNTGVTVNLGATGAGGSPPIIFSDMDGSIYYQGSSSTVMYKIANTQSGNTTATTFLANIAGFTNGDGARCFLSAFDPSTLPITLTGFNGSTTGCLTTLNWNTAAEENINHYDIEFSNDGKVFTKVGEKKALGRAGKYDFVYLQNAATGYYRLKIVESNNQTEFSAIISVKANCSEKEIIISPNPATDQLVINGLIKGSKINIFNQLGQKMASLTASGMSCNMAVNGYANGIYFIQITTPDGSLNNYRLLKQ